MNQQKDFPLLEIFTFGGLQLRCGGKPVRGLASRKAEALLVYLAVSGTPHPREILADFFWEDSSQSQALANLRTVLTILRKELDAYISIDRSSVGLRQGSNIWIDVLELKNSLDPVNRTGSINSPEIAAQIENALEIYRGDFLEGFYLRGCNSFEDWLVQEREMTRDLVLKKTHGLLDFNISIGNYQSAIALLKRILRLNPLMEAAHRQLMFLLHLEDQREAAIAQYESCKQILKDELAVEPSGETTALYEFILEEDHAGLSIAANFPELAPFLEQTRPKRPVFVGRETQLARLEEHLVKSINGEGQVVLVSGEAGTGKTALVSEFARQALDKYPNLLVASGRCNAFSGQGDAYFPIHQIFETLCCIKPPEWFGAADRLWKAFPQTLTTVLTEGPDLIDRLIDPEKVMLMAIGSKREKREWLDPLWKLIESERENLKVRNFQFIIDMCNKVLAAISGQNPLLIIIDDLQWVDNASCSLLFDLVRKLSDLPIFFIGMYRPSDVFSGGDGKNPFESLIYEARVQFGDTDISLDAVPEPEAKAFVDAFINSEQNQLDASFRENLFTQTGGHPLFTIELLRTLQDRGDIHQLEDQGWVVISDLSWDKLPAKVEGAIKARLARLDDRTRELLEVASVIGEEFDSQILARVLNLDEREIHRSLVKMLGGRHRLVTALEKKRITDGGGADFRFSHNLFQHYLYSDLGFKQQRLIHKEIAHAFEFCHPENLQALAYHYSKAAESEKAIDYLIKVADKARFQYAIREAVDHYKQVLGFIEKIGDQELAYRTWMKLALTYQTNFEFKAADQAYTKAFDLQTTVSESIRKQCYPPASQPLRHVSVEPSTLDPTSSSGMVSQRIARQLFSGLVKLSPGGNVLPDVARRWEVLDGGRRYVFHLREDCFWTDGVSVTAGDFEFAIKHALQLMGDWIRAVILSDIKNARLYRAGKITNLDLIGVTARDKYTLEFVLENPTAHFLQLSGSTEFHPIPRHAVEELGENWTKAENFVSNGPFQLCSWVPGQSIVLKKNPRYHGQFGGNLSSVEITFPNQVEDPLRAYLDGNFDILPGVALSLDQLVYARQFLGDEYYSVNQLGTTFLGFDTRTWPFDDPRVRRAISMATDRDALISKVYMGLKSPASGGLVPPGMPGHSPDIALPYDPHRARKLLAEAGFRMGKGFPIIEGVYAESVRTFKGALHSLTNYLQEMWLEIIGLRVNWTLISRKEMFQRSIDKIHSVIVTGWIADYYDPHNFFLDARWYYPRVISENQWDHPAFINLIQKAKGVLNQEERLNLYRQADRMIVEEAPIIPLYYDQTQSLQKPWVKGLAYWPAMAEFFEDVIIEEH